MKIKILKRILTATLVGVIALSPTIRVLGETTTSSDASAVTTQNGTSMYISDVAVGTASDLKAAGYTVVDGDLNAGATERCIGYKYTDDESQAITDMTALGMYDGFSKMTYQDMLKQYNAGIIDVGTKLQAASQEFRTNYNAGNPYAALAYKTLNALYIPLDDGSEVPLGTYMISTDRTLEDFEQIALMTSTNVITYIYNQLCLGVADNTAGGDTSWLTTLSANGPLEFTDENGEELSDAEIEAEYEESYDAKYMDTAKEIYTSVSSFVDSYEEAKERSGSTEAAAEAAQSVDQSTSDQLIEEMNSTDTVEIADSGEEGQDTNSEVSNEASGDAMILGVIDVLNEKNEDGSYVYPYGEDENGNQLSLGDYFLEVGSMEEGEDAYRALYPLLVTENNTTVLSEGQQVVFYLDGFSNMVTTACSDSDTLEEAQERTDTCINNLKAANDGDAVSIWYDVNTELYKSDDIYWTNRAATEAAAGSLYESLTKPVEDTLSTQEKLTNALIYTGMVAGAALTAGLIMGYILGHTICAFTMTEMVTMGFCCLACHMCFYTMAVTVGCIVGMVCIAIVALAVVAAIIIALIMFFNWLFGDDDEEEELELTTIPNIVYDYGEDYGPGGSFVSYHVVKDVSTGEAANLNVGNRNTPWLALYYSTDTDLGDPITAEQTGNSITKQPFVVQTDSMSTPDGYCPLCTFESITAADINAGRSGVAGVYCFLHKDRTEADKSAGKYLDEVKLVSASSAEEARTELKKAGYQLIDYNLTSDSDEFTYIGYNTTDDATHCTTDLRVAYATGQDPNGATINYGSASYGCCGNVGNLLLLKTNYSCAGTPVLASSLMVTGTLGDAPEGYEPVNLFCGGPAFDFNNCANWQQTTVDDGKEASDKWTSHSFVYFCPSVTYTSGTRYIGGLAFFSGTTDSYIKEMGWFKVSNSTLANGFKDTGITYDVGGVQDGNTYLCYTTTYNPYRAIYGIQYCACEANARGLYYQLNMGSSGSAVVCEVFQQGGGGVGNYRMLRPTHAYRSNNYYEGGGYFNAEDYTAEVEYKPYTIETGKNAEWYMIDGKETSSAVRCVGLYVLGNTASDISQAAPIKESELVVTASSSYNSSKYTPVRSITDYYSSTGANLAFNDLNNSGNMYLYIKRADSYASKPSYVASVTVKYVQGEDINKDSGSSTPYDAAVSSLISNGPGTLLSVNLTGMDNGMNRVTTYSHTYYRSGENGWDNEHYDTVRCMNHDSNYAVALVWVTYTTKQANAICDLALYESDSSTAPDSISDSYGFATTACGDGFQDSGKGKYYFLRAVPSGSSAITDIVIDKKVTTRQYWTTIGTNGTVSSYDRYYIKASHLQKSKFTYYISGIYYATGANESEAQKKLLEQGCRYVCPFNLAQGKSNPIYLGYSLSTSYKAAYSGALLEDCGQNEAVETIKYRNNTYNSITDTLNSGVYDSIIRLYMTQSAIKACESGATTAAKGHYITDICFFTGTDLNDYATGAKSLEDSDLSDEMKEYVQDYITDAKGKAVYWDIVTSSDGTVINCNYKANSNATPVYMYIHYSDNKTPQQDKLSASLFSDYASISVILVACVALFALGAYALLRKKRQESEG